MIRQAALLAAGSLLVACIHYVQRVHLDLDRGEVGVRWVAINGACLVSCVLAGWNLVQVLMAQRVVLAHLMLTCYIAISLAQFFMAVEPGWDMELFRLANLVFIVVSLLVYGARMVLVAARRSEGQP